MTEDELSELLQSGENVPVVAHYILSNPDMLEPLMNIALNDGPDSSWRAAWIVDKIHEKQPNLIVPFLSRIADFVLITTNSGKKRHLLKLISLNDIPDEKLATLLNYSIETFTNAAEPIAVRVHAMQVLYNVAEKEPDFAAELIDLIEHEIEYHGSAGIASRGRKLHRKLRMKQKERQNLQDRP